MDPYATCKIPSKIANEINHLINNEPLFHFTSVNQFVNEAARYYLDYKKTLIINWKESSDLLRDYFYLNILSKNFFICV